MVLENFLIPMPRPEARFIEQPIPEQTLMKNIISIPVFVFLSVLVAEATVSSTSVDNIFVTIPDANLNGVQSSQTLSGLPVSISDVNVTLNISGGFNGDF